MDGSAPEASALAEAARLQDQARALLAARRAALVEELAALDARLPLLRRELAAIDAALACGAPSRSAQAAPNGAWAGRVVGPTQAALLGLLAARSGSRVADLADALAEATGRRRAYVSVHAAVAALARRGLVQASGQGARHGWSLTEVGAKVAEVGAKAAAAPPPRVGIRAEALAVLRAAPVPLLLREVEALVNASAVARRSKSHVCRVLRLLETAGLVRRAGSPSRYALAQAG